MLLVKGSVDGRRTKAVDWCGFCARDPASRSLVTWAKRLTFSLSNQPPCLQRRSEDVVLEIFHCRCLAPQSLSHLQSLIPHTFLQRGRRVLCVSKNLSKFRVCRNFAARGSGRSVPCMLGLGSETMLPRCFTMPKQRLSQQVSWERCAVVKLCGWQFWGHVCTNKQPSEAALQIPHLALPAANAMIKKEKSSHHLHQVESQCPGVSGSQSRSQTDFTTFFLWTDPHFAQLDSKQRQLSTPTCYVRGSRCRCSDWLIRTVEYIQPCDGRCSKTHKVTTWTRVPQTIQVKAFVLFDTSDRPVLLSCHHGHPT